MIDGEGNGPNATGNSKANNIRKRTIAEISEMHKLCLVLCLATTVYGSDGSSIMKQVCLNDVSAATGGQAVGIDRGNVDVCRVETDSRQIRPGDLFWAVQGDRHDGHEFVAESLSRGAVACVVERRKLPSCSGRFVVVDDTLQALWRFARWYRDAQQTLVIGVTGSFGKTTTREMIHATLAGQRMGTRSPKNFNNHFGVPLSLLQIEPEHEFAVLELAASRCGEIRQLADIATPQIGVLTGIGPAHLDGFGSVEQVAQAKAELLEALPVTGLAVLAGDDPKVRAMAPRPRCRVVLVGQSADNDLRAEDISMRNDRLTFRVGSELFEVGIAGRHHVTGALAAIAVARELGIDSEHIAAGLRNFKPAPGRCQVKQIGPWTVIDDSYNASPAAVRSACQVLADWDGANQKVLAIGDMLELGDQSCRYHFEAGCQAAAAGIDHLMAFGSQACHVIRGAREAGMDDDRLAAYHDFDELLENLNRRLQSGDVVLVKGSRAMRMERVVQWLNRHAEKLVETHHPSNQTGLRIANGSAACEGFAGIRAPFNG